MRLKEKKMKKTLWILLITILLIGMGTRLGFLHKRLNLLKAPPRSEVPRQMITEDALLFDALLNAGLVTRADDGRLKPAPADLILIEKAESAKNKNRKSPASHPEETKKKERLINALYHSAAGSVVQTQMQLWNDTRFLTAIRDNRPKGSTGNLWRACDSRNPQWDFPRTGGRVPESFGFVNNGRLQPNFGDWLAAYTNDRAVEFRTTVTLETSRTVTVQIIGRPESIRPRPKRIESCCRKKTAENCTQANAEAFALHFALSSGKHELSVTASPARNTEPTISGLNIRIASGKFRWRKLPPRASASDKHFKVTTSDGVLLADDQGIPTRECEALGLLPLIGFGIRTPFSLSGILASSDLPPDMANISLTIESNIQSSAQKTLTRKIAELWPRDDYADERRGAVVILDADTGAILAAAGHPLPPPGTHPWDLASFSRIYPLKNPMLVRGWQGLDAHSAPGSTFKPVVALAAVKASENQSRLTNFLNGFTATALRRGTGLSPECAVYHPNSGKCYGPGGIPVNLSRKIQNFRRQPLSRVFLKNKGKKSVLGLREAIRDSVNIWFARLAMVMDGEKARNYDKAMAGRQKGSPVPKFPDFQLLKTARRLGFGNIPIDLGGNLPSNVRLYRRKPVPERFEGDVLYGHAGEMDLMIRRNILLWVLAQNSIGQGMSTTPLQMARVAATIAKGRIISPYLFSRWGETETVPPEAEALNINKERLDLLHAGMKAVPENGTAATAFKKHPDRARVYGKTGTANVGVTRKGKAYSQKKFFTTWFVGWCEPEQNTQRRLAFACMVTHASGKNKNTGGRVCAPIVADILSQIRLKQGMEGKSL